MTMNKAIVTLAEADGYLANQTDWLVLSNPVKTEHIAKASVYVQTRYTCTDVDWDDTENIPADIKEATAWFAYYDSQGLLYGDDLTDEGKGQIKRDTKKLGTLEKTTEYHESSGGNFDPLAYPEALMGSLCEKVGGGGSVKAVRT